MVLILGPGNISRPLLDYYRDSELIIACDKGARHSLEHSIEVDYYLGDFDSLAQEDYLNLPKDRIVRFPSKKDKSDFECALDLVRQEYVGNVKVKGLGFLGGRKDHELANIQLIASSFKRGLDLSLEDENNQISWIKKHQEVEGGMVYYSLLAVEDLWVSLEGFVYAGQRVFVPFGSSKGISNQLSAKTGKIILHEGSGFLICSRDSSF